MGTFKLKVAELFCIREKAFFYIIFILFFAVGAVLGVIFSTKIFSDFTIVFSTDYFLIVFSKEPLWQILFSRTINAFFLCLVMSLCFLTPFLVILDFAAIVYRGYLFGLVMSNVVSLYGVAGLLLLIFLLIPIQFCAHFLFISCSVNALICNKEKIIGVFIKRVLLIFAICIFLALVEMLLIVIFIRPLSFII